MIAGLGNYGTKYSHTRHNAGTLVVTEIGKRYDANWSVWRGHAANTSCLIAKIHIFEQKTLLVISQNYMNHNGYGIAAAARYFKILPTHLITVFDDLYIVPLQVKTRLKGSSGGHNGVQSVIDQLGYTNFPRIKIGIGRPGHSEQGDLNPPSQVSWVLSSFSTAELNEIKTTCVDLALQRIKQMFDQNPQVK
ncbi:MAG: aminoacyl-tRNA hydrolase [Proteobacteria bacterium]|nr:aminoacyl-tRNA hydrolase [Pseudomonadota bacterium]